MRKQKTKRIFNLPLIKNLSFNEKKKIDYQQFNESRSRWARNNQSYKLKIARWFKYRALLARGDKKKETRSRRIRLAWEMKNPALGMCPLYSKGYVCGNRSILLIDQRRSRARRGGGTAWGCGAAPLMQIDLLLLLQSISIFISPPPPPSPASNKSPFSSWDFMLPLLFFLFHFTLLLIICVGRCSWK